MTQGALAHLSKNENGFFLMIEGGATDWSAHTSLCGSLWDYGACVDGEPEYGRIIEETADFNNSVQAVVDWVEKNSNWGETLVIVTTDHDNGAPMGPDAQSVPFQPVVNNGKGNLPGFSFRPTGDHTNALVPLWAKGLGADGFEKRVRGKDAGFAQYVAIIGNDGSYVDNTDVHAVVKAALTGEDVVAIGN